MGTIDKRIVIATHYLAYGAPQALREYLISQKVKELLFVANPLQYNGDERYWETIKDGVVISCTSKRSKFKNPLFNYVLDFITIFRVVVPAFRSDMYIGVDSLNALAGVLLKKIGLTNKTVFYTIDYVPKRFNNRVLNYFYRFIDSFCIKNCDEVWDVSVRIAKARQKYQNIELSDYKKRKIVPIGVWFNRVKRLEFTNIKKHQLIFVGHLLEKQGVQYVIEAIPLIIKSIPDFHFLIVGGGEYEATLKELASNLKVDNHVTFMGWVKDRTKLDSLLAESAIAIAMYKKYESNGSLSFTYFADPTKLKDYLSAGLPILLTDVPHNAHEIEKKKCGKIIAAIPEIIARETVALMCNEKKLKEYRANALRYIYNYDWSFVFSSALGFKKIQKGFKPDN